MMVLVPLQSAWVPSSPPAARPAAHHQQRGGARPL